ncbi:MAG: hypothetical protein V3T15_04620 [Pseudomonadales bacterium]
MSKSLRLFVRFMAVVLTLAIAAPFYLTDPGGRPLLSLDRVTRHLRLPSAVSDVWEDPAPEGTEKLRVEGVAVYRWRDEYGIWQFGEAVPEGIAAEAVDVQSRITPLGSDWRVENADEESSGSMVPGLTGSRLGGSPLGGNPLGGNPLEAYAQAPDLMEKAKQVVDQIESRNAQLRALTP